MIKSRIFNNDKGMALITSLLILASLTLLGYISINTIVIDMEITGNMLALRKSFYIAEAGLSDALDTLDQNFDNWASYAANTTLIAPTPFAAGSYTVSIELEDASHDSRKVISTGTSRSGAQSSIMIILNPEYDAISPFQTGLHGCSGVVVHSNGQSQSYSSSDPNYVGNNGDISTSDASADIELESGAKVSGSAFATGNLILRSNADISNDAVATGIITLFSAHIWGDAETSANAYGITVHGTTTENVSPDAVPVTPCDPLDITTIFADAADIITSNNNADLSPVPIGGTLYKVMNDTTFGSTGTEKSYYFSGFDIKNNKNLTIEGDVTLYVDGDFLTSSNSNITMAANSTLTIYVTGIFSPASNTEINNSGEPKDLTIYSNASSSSATDYKVDFRSNTDLRGVVYAPNAAVMVHSNADTYGAVVGKWTDVASNANFYYDENLAHEDFGGPPSTIPTGFTKMVWRKL